MKNENEYALARFEEAVKRLQEAAEKAKDDLQKDGTIQRFEFTVELLWKTLKIILNQNGIETKTPKESLREAFRLGWLEKEEAFLNMLEDRNKTSHLYNKQMAEDIFERIKKDHTPAITAALKKLKEGNYFV